MITEELRALYKSHYGTPPSKAEPLQQAGSGRRYYRLYGETPSRPTVIGVCGVSTDENEAFIYLSNFFREQGLPVPQVLDQSADGLCYLQEDLGDLSLFEAISEGRASGSFSQREVQLLTATIRLLPHIQYCGTQGLAYERCYPVKAFDEQSVMWDLNYFKYCFLKATLPDFREDMLENDFTRLARTLVNLDKEQNARTFMYRDFQSRNIMIKDGAPWFIDFQGGRCGPIYYDVASFLGQAKANFPTELRRQLIQEYINALGNYRTVPSTDDFWQRLRLFVLFRQMQVLGVYGLRGYFEQKPHFLQSIPFALNNIRHLLSEPFDDYPYLSSLLLRLAETDKQKTKQPTNSTEGQLTVTVWSFAYKRGIPADESGNHGGFVFDCRAIHNPGRYEQFRHLTGRDKAVMDFLEQDGEMARFLEHVHALLDMSVQRYLKRKFTSLVVCFGCTGGQHRSVYAAQKTAEYLAHTYPEATIRLIHREQGIHETLNKS